MGSQISCNLKVSHTSCHFVFASHENIEHILSIWMKRLEYGIEYNEEHYTTATPEC